MRRINLALSAATAFGAVLYCAPLASAAPPFTLLTRVTEATTTGDGSSQGSELVIAEDVYRDNQMVGRAGVTCTIVRVDPLDDSRDMQCVATFLLAGGDITLQGRLTFTQAPTDFDVAVTGGTGIYSDASGTAHGHVVNETDTEVTISLNG
ncbi:allene oxide cyclase barrel-like domain-containing protein [Streptomyces sp. NPDC054841]